MIRRILLFGIVVLITSCGIKSERKQDASLKRNAAAISHGFHGDTIQLIVLSNGKIAEVTMNNSSDTQLVEYVSGIVKELPDDWFPALAHPTDVLDLWDFPEQENKIKIRANSIV